MNSRDPSLRLRFWPSLVLFLSAYSPLMAILVINDYDRVRYSWLPQHPALSGFLLFVAILSICMVLGAAKVISGGSGGLSVTVIKTANNSGDMLGYTVPYMLSFLHVDLSNWQTLVNLCLFLVILFVMAYRTQTVFVNPVLALAGYMLLDCAFKRGDEEIQAMVITRKPLAIGETCQMERLSHCLYMAVKQHDFRERSTGNERQ